MIAALAFESPRRRLDGRIVRRIGFRAKSDLPLSAVCLVANGVREAFAQLLGCRLESDVFEAAILERPAAIAFEEAIVRRFRGRLCDVFIGVRRADAGRLVATAFGECERSATSLSEIEAATLERLVGALAPLCVPLCGEIRGIALETAEVAAAEATTYFEIRLSGGVEATLAFALTADPAGAVGAATLQFADLAEVEVECVAECAVVALGAAELAALRPGMTLRLETQLDAGGTLTVGGIPFARGTCGARGGRAAFIVERRTRPEAA